MVAAIGVATSVLDDTPHSMIEEADMEYKNALNNTNQERIWLESDLYTISFRNLQHTILWTSQISLEANSEEDRLQSCAPLAQKPEARVHDSEIRKSVE